MSFVGFIIGGSLWGVTRNLSGESKLLNLILDFKGDNTNNGCCGRLSRMYLSRWFAYSWLDQDCWHHVVQQNHGFGGDLMEISSGHVSMLLVYSWLCCNLYSCFVPEDCHHSFNFILTRYFSCCCLFMVYGYVVILPFVREDSYHSF